MHRSERFRNSCQWNFTVRGLVFPHTATTGLLGRSRSKLVNKLAKERHGRLIVRPGSASILHDRVKPVGIHRAQPMSYLHEHDVLHDCAPADWADLAHDEQVAAYIAIRNFRSEHVDEIIEDAKQRWTSRASQERRRNNYRAPEPESRSVGKGGRLFGDPTVPEAQMMD
ncbi:hypothetical protein LY78DRAFT_686482 [Colletotrichum sublineola]|uniref:Uncharacterized protein n=1 Tax=Colletotrichum sublineola TaxID=1173701 RepID=A0A066XHN2_COLSU|nr:hypothetical protein LY78DRAFT_686482 [Colletotrichum sublineola]KDN67159.1 hypothetical protein CSUB01_11078 [Colletotrichum sublineola]